MVHVVLYSASTIGQIVFIGFREIDWNRQTILKPAPVVATDGLGTAAVNCPNGDDAFSSSSRKECTFASIDA